ncbi:MAG: FHA domain-containing protein [Porphyromonas sp.]|nr:FHA domain-containing protein [Porphyromonas sp.]
MKRVSCPKCDYRITISNDRIRQALADRGRLVLVCPSCGRQIKAQLKTTGKQEQQGMEERGELSPAVIIVVENAFAYRQVLRFGKGIHSVGRQNKDTEVDLAIQTSDPSMDRHHCLIRAEVDSQGHWTYALKDDDSRVGTFVAGFCLGDKEWLVLRETTIITLGATSLIFEPHPDKDTIEEDNTTAQTKQTKTK